MQKRLAIDFRVYRKEPDKKTAPEKKTSTEVEKVGQISRRTGKKAFVAHTGFTCRSELFPDIGHII